MMIQYGPQKVDRSGSGGVETTDPKKKPPNETQIQRFMSLKGAYPGVSFWMGGMADHRDETLLAIMRVKVSFDKNVPQDARDHVMGELQKLVPDRWTDITESTKPPNK